MSKLVRGIMLILLPFAVVRCVTVFASREAVAARLDNAMRLSSQLTGSILRSGAVPDRLSSRELFQRAYGLGESREALILWQRMISETPLATDIDYAYGHAVACAAYVGDCDLTLTYYEVLCRDFDGWRHTGSGGASRNWDFKRKRARVLIGAHPRSAEVLRRMDELDRAARDRRIAWVCGLVRRANAGDPLAKPLLLSNASNMEMLVDLAAEGRLRLAEPREPRERDEVRSPATR